MPCGRLSLHHLLAVCVLLTLTANLAASETVIVYMKDGRVLSGQVDSRTDDAELWIHSRDASITISNAVSWGDVDHARVRQKTLTSEEFKGTAGRLKATLPARTGKGPARIVAPLSISPVPRIQSLEIFATLGNWDADSQPDGLEVRVDAVAGQQAFPVNGIVSVRLMGRRLGTTERLESQNGFGFYTDGASVREYARRRYDARYVEVGRWSERLTTAAWSPNGYVLRLPFRSTHPEHDLDIALDGQVLAHLSVQGQGVYEATSPIQLRTYSPFRDELQLYRGTRFFPDESSGW